MAQLLFRFYSSLLSPSFHPPHSSLARHSSVSISGVIPIQSCCLSDQKFRPKYALIRLHTLVFSLSAYKIEILTFSDLSACIITPSALLFFYSLIISYISVYYYLIFAYIFLSTARASKCSRSMPRLIYIYPLLYIYIISALIHHLYMHNIFLSTFITCFLLQFCNDFTLKNIIYRCYNVIQS